VQTFVAGDQLKAKVTGYTYHAPELSAETAIALAVMIIGAVFDRSPGKERRMPEQELLFCGKFHNSHALIKLQA